MVKSCVLVSGPTLACTVISRLVAVSKSILVASAIVTTPVPESIANAPSRLPAVMA